MLITDFTRAEVKALERLKVMQFFCGGAFIVSFNEGLDNLGYGFYPKLHKFCKAHTNSRAEWKIDAIGEGANTVYMMYKVRR